MNQSEIGLLGRIVKRLTSPDEATFRGGGRAVMRFVADEYTSIKFLEGLLVAIQEIPESNPWRLGYLNALVDLLMVDTDPDVVD